MMGRRRRWGRLQRAMVAAVADGRAELLIGVCVTCDRGWFAVDDVGQPCPADTRREHAVNYYTLVGVLVGAEPEG
jgi:hypothetical protein